MMNDCKTVCSSNGIWSKLYDDVTCNQLHKFWSELSPEARQDLLRVDKQTLFEQARKNMYCSRCNGLLLESFMEIVMHSKSSHHEETSIQFPCDRFESSKDQIPGGQNTTYVCQDGTQNPSLHSWGGLTTTRDGALTLLDFHLYSKSLKAIQNVFDSARARERERVLLYPDACGGGGRGWIGQGIASYGRGHGTRETCALHTTRLSCDTLVEFWSSLGEERRQSLLRMKEEDFIERLMYRFNSKRFCRGCRKNVVREFKDLKELKRTRRETRCTSWFCVADTDFQCEVSNDTILADWSQTFVDSIGTYDHFEWAVGSKEGNSDILEFENVGLNGSAQVNGLDLAGLNACYITLRAFKLDEQCTEFSVKAHALNGRPCVHCRLMVGHGYVTIACGESISRFFEHAEEAEEEEDDDSLDKDGNDRDGECPRPQKHAKSPELAREFLLDAATVIFKEQVEKAYRERAARENAHSIFVCLALELLEDRIHISCKEITTLEKQIKLLEEEEKEKREEEERKERKRTKEREKKVRRKEKLRGKGKDKKYNESKEVTSAHHNEEADNSIRSSVSENSDTNISQCTSPDVFDKLSLDDFLSNDFDVTDGELSGVKEGSGWLTLDKSKGSQRILNTHRDLPLESSSKWTDKSLGTENGEVAHKSTSRYYDRSDLHSCGSNQQNDYSAKVKPYSSTKRLDRHTRPVTISESVSDKHKPVHCINKHNHTDYVSMHDICGRPRSKITSLHTKKVWEPVEPQARSPQKNLESDVTLSSCSFNEKSNLNETRDFTASSNSSSDDNNQVSEERDTTVVDVPQSSPTELSSQNVENGKIDVLPTFHNPNINFPVFQCPSATGYYHQNPMTWPTFTNGLMTYPQPNNHYLLTSPFGYGLTSPLINHNQIPVYQHACMANCWNPGDQTNAHIANKAPQMGSSEEQKSTKSDTENRGFSLFQFGGPLAVPNYRISSLLESDNTCSKEETVIEEYNLFSTRNNGIRFSILECS